MAYKRKDFWYLRAKQEGYRSRAAYKLMELDQRLRLFSRGMKVVDLGCAPGGWAQVASDRVGDSGLVVGIDRLECAPLPAARARLLRGDVTDPACLELLRREIAGPADVVLSDMAPDTCGVGMADHVRSVSLVETAAVIALQLLGPRGVLVAKVFEGPDLAALLERLKSSFSEVKRLHLKSTRAGSRELYLAARRGGPRGRDR